MPLQTSGPISIANLRGEFGGAAPDGMSEYRAGGGRVPSGCSGISGAIPSTLSNLNLGRFYGACVATAPPSVSGRVTMNESGPPHTGIMTTGVAAYPYDYSNACYNADAGVIPGGGSFTGSLSIASRTEEAENDTRPPGGVSQCVTGQGAFRPQSRIGRLQGGQ